MVDLCIGFVLQISFGPISWLMVSEVFPLRTRGKGISLAVLTNFASNAVVTFAFSPLKVSDYLLSFVFIFYFLFKINLSFLTLYDCYWSL